MAKIELDSDSLTVRLTASEKLFALRRADVRVPLREVRDVAVEADALHAVHGMRAPGLGLPGLRYIGTWRRRHGWRSFVSVSRNVPAVRITTGGALDELLVSTPAAEAVARELRARL